MNSPDALDFRPLARNISPGCYFCVGSGFARRRVVQENGDRFSGGGL